GVRGGAEGGQAAGGDGAEGDGGGDGAECAAGGGRGRRAELAGRGGGGGMSTVHSTPTTFPDSDYEDGVYYPSSDGKPTAETGIHVHALLMLYHLLQVYYKDRSDVLITGNQFWYWERGNPKARRAPDVMVVVGVPKEPPRR